MHTTYAIPERSLQQRQNALEIANQVRSYRATLKLDLKAGRKSIVKLIMDPPEMIKTMKVFDLLLHVPKIGRVKAHKLLTVCRMSASKTIEGMSDRQRNELVHMLGPRGYCRHNPAGE